MERKHNKLGNKVANNGQLLEGGAAANEATRHHRTKAVGGDPPQMPMVQPPNANDRDAVQSLPSIEAEAPENIHIGAGGKLVVPREDLLADLDDGTELDLVNAQATKVRRPDRREWVALKRDSELTTRMLLHRPKADGIDVEHYYINKALRGPIRDELKDVRVFLFYSFKVKAYGLWVINVTPENSWYASLHALLQRPAEFFIKNAIRVVSDKANSRYRVRYKSMPSDVTWPVKTTGELLAEALGQDRFIMSADHPVYRDLIEGAELG